MAAVDVSNLFTWVNEERVRSVFKPFGNIISVDLPAIKPEAPTTTAVVYFEHQMDAVNAAERLNFSSTTIGDPLIVQARASANSSEAACGYRSYRTNYSRENQVKPANQQTLILIKNFGNVLDEDDLESMFQGFGSINSVSIKRDNGQSLGYGYVDFDEHTSAVRAIQSMDGAVVKERKLSVVFVKKKEEHSDYDRSQAGTVRDKRNDKPNFVLYVKNLPKDIDNDDLIKLFERFGSIVSVSVKKDQRRKNAVGFVAFENRCDASTAISEMDGHVVGSEALSVVFKEEKWHAPGRD